MVCCTQGLIKTRPVSVLELRLDSGSITVIPSDVKRDKTGLVTEMMVQAVESNMLKCYSGILAIISIFM